MYIMIEIGRAHISSIHVRLVEKNKRFMHVSLNLQYSCHINVISGYAIKFKADYPRQCLKLGISI